MIIKKKLFLLAIFVACYVQINNYALATKTSASTEEIYYIDQANLFQYDIKSTTGYNTVMEIKIENKVTKADGTEVINDPNITYDLIMDNGKTYSIEKDKFNVDNVRYALLALYNSEGVRLNNNFYFIITKPSQFSLASNDIPIKIKSKIDKNISADYRRAKIEIKLTAFGVQVDPEPALEDAFRIDLSTANPAYFNIPTPNEGTIDEFSTTSNDQNISQKSLVDNFFIQVR